MRINKLLSELEEWDFDAAFDVGFAPAIKSLRSHESISRLTFFIRNSKSAYSIACDYAAQLLDYIHEGYDGQLAALLLALVDADKTGVYDLSIRVLQSNYTNWSRIIACSALIEKELYD